MPLHANFGERTINELLLISRNRQINLEPGFQRNSVWSDLDRGRFIQSIISNYPVPCIFLYQRNSRGKTVYDVIDGKQRLETILMFTGTGHFRRDRFDVKLSLGDGLDWYDWSELRRHPTARHQFETYKIQTVEVTGDLSEIVDLFVRINSTGKRLTSGEKRHAKFYRSQFLKQAEHLVERFERYLLHQKILSKAQIDRMKGTELFAELLMSLNNGGPINKKTSLDRAIGNESVNGNTLHKLSREFIATLNLLKRMFPELRQTRFHNSAEFYTLFLLVWQMSRDKFVLHNKARNRIAFALLKRLSTEVDQLRQQLRKASIPKRAQPIYRDYLLTVQGDTDSAATRERRASIVKGLLDSLYERKDEKRAFSTEQRRIIWNSEDQHYCRSCRKRLAWDDFTVDHIIAHVRGGRTSLRNAQLMCRSCNSKKGSR
jgi:Protein of unknown function DUF262/HNH endonuclease